MKDLQAIIDKRAEEKLNSEIKEINDFLIKNRSILETFKIYYRNKEGKDEYTEPTFIFQENRFGKQIFETNIQRYKEKESIKFLKEFEDLKAKVETLNEEINYLQ